MAPSTKSDPYAALGVERDVTASDLKQAYRRRAMDLHPDRHPERPDATARFVEIKEAYELLSDPAKRQAYDLTLPPVAGWIRARARVPVCVRGDWYDSGETFWIDPLAMTGAMERADQPHVPTFGERLVKYHQSLGIAVHQVEVNDFHANADLAAAIAPEVERKTARRSKSTRPSVKGTPRTSAAKLVKGSAEARERMAEIRKLRGKKDAAVQEKTESANERRVPAGDGDRGSRGKAEKPVRPSPRTK